MKQSELKDWQRDATKLDTTNVQVWGETMIGLVGREEARTMIRNGTHFVITSQAIGMIG